jgi:hypothetical protein
MTEMGQLLPSQHSVTNVRSYQYRTSPWAKSDIALLLSDLPSAADVIGRAVLGPRVANARHSGDAQTIGEVKVQSLFGPIPEFATQ